MRAQVGMELLLCAESTSKTERCNRSFCCPSQYFGEGLTVVNGSLVQLTWQNKIGFIYDKETFGLLGNFSYSTEGWGLTYNGSELNHE